MFVVILSQHGFNHLTRHDTDTRGVSGVTIVGLLVDLAVELEFGLLGKGASRLASGNHDSLVLDHGTADETVLGLDDVIGSVVLYGNSPATNLARAVLLVKVVGSHDNDVTHVITLGDHLYKDFGHQDLTSASVSSILDSVLGDSKTRMLSPSHHL